MIRALLSLLLATAITGRVANADAPRRDLFSNAEAEELIDQLVFKHERGSASVIIAPQMTTKDDEAYRKEFEKCQEAFRKLLDLKEAGLPALTKHLDDKRISINFRNHYEGHSVGDACYWNLYAQLMDQPMDYSSYGLTRQGRDGKRHTKPYWDGTPFDEAGGLEKCLEKNKALSYPEKQIKCLNWLLGKEKAIGAPDAESYFENILPLEIRILERKLETGSDVGAQLRHLRKVLKEKIVSETPVEFRTQQPPSAN